MKAAGVVRKIDRLGRVVIPMEVRRIHQIEAWDDMEILVEEDRVILQKFTPSCVFCQGKGVEEFHGKNVCRSCREELTTPEPALAHA